MAPTPARKHHLGVLHELGEDGEGAEPQLNTAHSSGGAVFPLRPKADRGACPEVSQVPGRGGASAGAWHRARPGAQV